MQKSYLKLSELHLINKTLFTFHFFLQLKSCLSTYHFWSIIRIALPTKNLVSDKDPCLFRKRHFRPCSRMRWRFSFTRWWSQFLLDYPVAVLVTCVLLTGVAPLLSLYFRPVKLSPNAEVVSFLSGLMRYHNFVQLETETILGSIEL